MKVNVQSVNFSADQKLITHIQRRLDKLERYYDRIVDGEVFLKVDNNHTRQNKITEIKINIPGHDLVVKKQCKSFEEAADLSTEALRRQLKKHKEKTRISA
jgi:putative sigma-54 modulation protein